MSYMHTDIIIEELLNRIGDFENDPEPEHDEFLEEIPIHTRQQLKHALLESYSTYKKGIING